MEAATKEGAAALEQGAPTPSEGGDDPEPKRKRDKRGKRKS